MSLFVVTVQGCYTVTSKCSYKYAWFFERYIFHSMADFGLEPGCSPIIAIFRQDLIIHAFQPFTTFLFAAKLFSGK